METKLEELIKQWEQAFDRKEELLAHKQNVQETLYAEGPRYDLSKFDWHSFPADGPLQQDKTGLHASALHEYGFNAKGLPCYTTFKHEHNKILWEGVYVYGDTSVEYIEYCMNTGVPSIISRMEFKDGKKVTYQSLRANSGGSGYGWLSKEDIIKTMRNDDHSFIINITDFEYDATGKIQRASSIRVFPGSGQHKSYDEYNYDDMQVLDTIRQFDDKGNNGLIYCRRPENMSPEQLSEELAEALAKQVVLTLEHNQIEQPIALLELAYRLGVNYAPYLECQSVKQITEKLAKNEVVFFDTHYNESMNVSIRPFERLWAQMEQLMEDYDYLDVGTNMIRKAAFLLTKNKLFGKFEVSDIFAAYAVDWSIEGHGDDEFEEILTECGVDAERLAAWKQIGILPLSK